LGASGQRCHHRQWSIAILDPLTEDDVPEWGFEFFALVEAAGIEP
jgi:hypothetical protein